MDGGEAGGGREAFIERRRARESELAGRPSGFVGNATFHAFSSAAGLALRVVGLAGAGHRNALSVRVEEIVLDFPGLPPAFDGYRILHLSDMHFDRLPRLSEELARTLAGTEVDLVAVTGDFMDRQSTPAEVIAGHAARVLGSVTARDGVFATLGNHDAVRLLPALSAIGIRMLLNETATVRRGDERIRLTGIDDVHSFATPHAFRALADSGDGFKIALVHSPEAASEAERAGFRLYLAGHTHGGQLCLPGGRPLFTGIRRPHRKLCAGLWRVGEMTGYTSRGAGVTKLPFRFNCPGEATLFVLRALSE